VDCWGCGRITSVEGNSTLGVEEREHVIWRDMSIKKRHFLPAGIYAHNALICKTCGCCCMVARAGRIGPVKRLLKLEQR